MALEYGLYNCTQQSFDSLKEGTLTSQNLNTSDQALNYTVCPCPIEIRSQKTRFKTKICKQALQSTCPTSQAPATSPHNPQTTGHPTAAAAAACLQNGWWPAGSTCGGIAGKAAFHHRTSRHRCHMRHQGHVCVSVGGWWAAGASSRGFGMVGQ